MPGSGDKTGKQERFILALMDVQKELQERLKNLLDEKCEAERMIDSLSDADERAVMRMYYLSCMSMEEIAKKVDKERTWAYRARREALRKLAK